MINSGYRNIFSSGDDNIPVTLLGSHVMTDHFSPHNLQYSPPSLATSSSSSCVLRRVNVSIFCSWCSCLSAQNSVATFIIRNIAQAENKLFFHKTSINKQTYFQIQYSYLHMWYVTEDCHSIAITTYMEKIEIFLFHYKLKILY